MTPRMRARAFALDFEKKWRADHPFRAAFRDAADATHRFLLQNEENITRGIVGLLAAASFAQLMSAAHDLNAKQTATSKTTEINEPNQEAVDPTTHTVTVKMPTPRGG